MSGDEVHRSFNGAVLKYTDEEGNLTVPLEMVKAMVAELEAAEDLDEIRVHDDIELQGEQSVTGIDELESHSHRTTYTDSNEITASRSFDDDDTTTEGGVTYRDGTELTPNSTVKTQGVKYQVLDDQMTSQTMRRADLAGMLPRGREKARICFMFDWDDESHYDWLYPKFESRQLPWQGNFSWHRVREGEGNVSLSQLAEMIVAGGMECGIYPRDSTGKNLDTMAEEDPQLVVDFLQGVRRDFEEHNIPISYLQFREGRGLNMEDVIDDTPQMHTIRSLFIASGSGGHRPRAQNRILAPQINNNPDTWGSLTEDHWLSGGANLGALDNPSDFKAYLDRMIAVGGQATFFGHGSEIMGGIGESEFEAILDHVVAARKQGDVEVCTKTSYQTVPCELEALNIVPDPDATASHTYDVGDYWGWTRGTPSTADTDPRTGSAHYVLGGDDELGLLTTELEPEWNSVTFDVHARAPDSETAHLRFRSDEQDGSQPRYASDSIEVGDRWERVFGQVGNMRDAVRGLYRIQNVSGTVWLDDVKIYPA